MKDRNVVIYGLTPADNDPTDMFMTAVAVADNGMIYTIMTLGGNGIEATSPWASGNINMDGWRGPFVPVTCANFLIGGQPDLESAYYSAMCRQSPGTAGVVQNAVITDRILTTLSNDSPAANTAAVLDLSAGSGNPVLIKKIHATINAVAAITAPVALQVIEDFGGGEQTTILQKRFTCPAGQTVDIELDCDFGALSNCRVTIAAPGATNFCDLNVEWLGTWTDPPYTGDASPV